LLNRNSNNIESFKSRINGRFALNYFISAL